MKGKVCLLQGQAASLGKGHLSQPILLVLLEKAFCVVVVTKGTDNTVKLDPNSGEKPFFPISPTSYYTGHERASCQRPA